ncbi:glycosyltransferase family 2 protein [Tolypothrix sp. FACHB-123]|uniref:glycosyltransferase family 2 protein n=1 Tax=Tolypothrix sp. FACHB-123 TaxID=2692868 RepID=UPI0016824D8D|nr:glycosyltransferase family A protein [Tolypothrix sp. FACHB-123]MBD2358448.1 glycosyltransferase family 2 protein [Tolypothrix sp. FACHB-123]
MNVKPLISVIMPFLNTQKYIQESIESVLAQHYTNWELLLIDDGSTDGSTEIAKQYAQQYPEKIHYLEHEDHQNRGASASRNVGLRNSKGSCIAFLDGDDIWLPFNLSLLVGHLNSHPEAAMVYGPTQWWYSWTDNSDDMAHDYVCDLGLQANILYKPPALFIPYFLKQSAITPCTCSLLIRREVVEAIGGFEESFRYVYTDQAFYAKVALKSAIFVISECGAKYRQHPNSSCAVVEKTGKAFAARSKFLHWVEKYLSEQKVEEPQIWQALEKALWPYNHPFQNKLITYVQDGVSQIKMLVKSIVRKTLPVEIRNWLRVQWQEKG